MLVEAIAVALRNLLRKAEICREVATGPVFPDLICLLFTLPLFAEPPSSCSALFRSDPACQRKLQQRASSNSVCNSLCNSVCNSVCNRNPVQEHVWEQLHHSPGWLFSLCGKFLPQRWLNGAGGSRLGKCNRRISFFGLVWRISTQINPLKER